MSADTIPNAATPAVELLMPATWHRLELDPDLREASIQRIVEETTHRGPEFQAARERMRVELQQAAGLGAVNGATLAFVYWSAPAGKLASASLFVAVIDATKASPVPLRPEKLAAALAARYSGETGALTAGPAARCPAPRASSSGRRVGRWA